MSDLHRYFDKKVILVIVFFVNLYITKLIIPIIIFAIYINSCIIESLKSPDVAETPINKGFKRGDLSLQTN